MLYTRKLVYIYAVAILLSSTSAYAFEKPENDADCERIVAEIGWKLENPTTWPQYGVCDAAPPKTGIHVQDMKVSLDVPSYDGLTLFSMAGTSVMAREVLASFVRTREKSVGTRNNVTYLPTEYIAVGDEAVLWLDERMTDLSYYDSLLAQRDENKVRNYDGGAVSQWSGEVKFAEGRCVVRVFGNSSFNTTWGDSTNDPQFFEYYHQFEPDLDANGRVIIGGGGVIINRHPDFDHGKAGLRDFLITEAKKIDAAVKPICGDTTTTTAPPENVPEVGALVEKQPTDADLQLRKDDIALPVIKMVKLDGLADFQLPDGTWMPIEEGDTIPSDGTLQTQYGSTAELHFSDGIIILVGPLTEFNIKEFNLDPQSWLNSKFVRLIS